MIVAKTVAGVPTCTERLAGKTDAERVWAQAWPASQEETSSTAPTACAIFLTGQPPLCAPVLSYHDQPIPAPAQFGATDPSLARRRRSRRWGRGHPRHQLADREGPVQIS